MTWTTDFTEHGCLSATKAIENAVFDLKAVNPNRKSNADTRTPSELLDLIEAKGKEIAEVLAVLRKPAGV